MKYRFTMTRREGTLAAWSGVFVAVVLYVTYVAYPLGVRCMDLRSRLDAVRERYEEATGPKETAARLRADIRAFKAMGIRESGGGKSETPDSVGAAMTVVTLAKSAGVTVESVKPGQPDVDSGLAYIPVAFSVRGTVGDLVLFLALLDERKPPVSVSVMKLGESGKAGAASLSGELECFTGEGVGTDGKR